jgi:hypothetical protein
MEVEIRLKIQKLKREIELLELSLNENLNENGALKPITEIEIKQNVEKLRSRHVVNGIEGFSKYIIECYKDKIVCKDTVKKIFYYKDENENIIHDHRLNILITKIFSSIRNKSLEIIDSHLKHTYNDEVLSKSYEKNKHELETTKLNIVKTASGLESYFKTKLVTTVINLINLK